ncbi:uncharacterized protein LOC123673437 [Harmonia axyridis]|uniref:uncharacterized protein LOC123673437 n=1 Tax=Harmonia axyridis TaxID=115357 RepID=UPI001E2768A2|nr:uncharacterized protein LOC123673437 [Harmonia axyridis]
MFAALILISIVIILLYLVVIKPFKYWEERDVKTGRVIPVFGDNYRVAFGLESFVEQTQRMYDAFPNDRYYGLYQFFNPALVIRTPDIIKKCCVKDFDHFLNRRNFAAEGADVLFSKNLLNLKGQSWKNMRSTLSPTFTGSKMKAMFELVCQNAKLFTDYFLEKKEDITEIELKDSVQRFTSDVIANAAFGIQVDSLKDRKNTFFMMGRDGLNFNNIRIKIAFILYQLSPKLASILGIPIIATKVQDFFISLVKDTLKMREEQNIKRPDVLGLLLDARKGKLDLKEKDEDGGFAVVKEHLEVKSINSNLSDLDIAAQAFLFFLAGFEAVATLICLTVHELAVNPDIQKKLIDEIDENWPEDDKPSYNKVMNMTYLDMVVSEALRKWPNAILTDRTVTKEYTIQPELPGEKPLKLKEGSIVLIPIMGFHHDPKYFPNPEKFDPERFSAENKNNIDPYTYMPFGIGPRNCIGSRFALMEVKALIFYIFRHFEVVPIEKTEIPPKFNKNAFGFIPENGFHLGLKKRSYQLAHLPAQVQFAWNTYYMIWIIPKKMFVVFFLSLVLMMLVYFVVIKPFQYWKKKNVKTGVVIPLFGDNFRVVFGLEGIIDQARRIYNSFPNERYYGLYQFSRPVLVIRNPDLIKKFCVKDFDYFFNRRDFATEEADILFSKYVLSLKGQIWRDMRSTLSPTFTSSKMKAMFMLICYNAKLFTDYFLEREEDIIEVELKGIIHRYTCGVMTSTLLGIQMNFMKDINHFFFKLGADFGSLRMKISSFLYQISPKIASILKVPIIAKYPQEIFINLVKDTIKTREKQNIKLTDFLGLLLDARKEKVRAKEQHGRNDSGAVIKEESEQKNSNWQLTDVDITAQVFVYFLAGFEAVATQICLTILELAIHSDVQNRLIDEIDRNWPEDREPNYNEVINMPYLDMVVSESLRKWPNGILTDRIVTKEYTIQPELPGEKPVTLKEGTVLMISILGLHNDPKYFPNPEKFDPERFSPENKSNIHPYTYIPFGIGPRNCIGSRFALLEIKALLFYLFRHFEVVPIETTDIPPKFNKNAAGFIPINGFHVGFKRRRLN